MKSKARNAKQRHHNTNRATSMAHKEKPTANKQQPNNPNKQFYRKHRRIK
jgi:hypothetical protein